jgi:hypothetical protein
MKREDAYVIFSTEHQRWWGPGQVGYVERLSGAGLYSREQALRICLNAAPQARSVLYEIPVRYADIAALAEGAGQELAFIPRPLT